MLMHSAVAGAYCASKRVSRATCASAMPCPPNSFGIAILRYPAAFSSLKSSRQNVLSRSYLGARSRHRSRSGWVSTELEAAVMNFPWRSEEHTSELQSHSDLVCRLLLEKKKRRR